MNEPMTTVDGFLVVRQSKYAYEGRARWSFGIPSLDRGEIAIKVRLHVPQRMFRVPVFEVDMTVTDPAEPLTLEVVGAALRSAGIVASIMELPVAERREEMIDDAYQAARE